MGLGLNRRQISLLILAICVLGGSLFYIRFFLARPMGVGPAGPEVGLEGFQDVWSDRQVMLLGLGDSVTSGFGADSPSHSYFQRIFQNPADEFAEMQGKCLSSVLPNLRQTNLAISGSTSIQHLDRISSMKPFQKDTFGLVMITTGGNDIIHNYGLSPPKEGAMYGATWQEAQPWIDNFRQRLLQIISAIKTLFPGGCEIYLADIYDPTDGVGDAASIMLKYWQDGLKIHTAYNAIIREVCDSEADVYCVPLHANFLGHGSHCSQFWLDTYRHDDPTYWYYENIEDPNDRGYDAIRRIFLRTIIENSRLRSTAN